MHGERAYHNPATQRQEAQAVPHAITWTAASGTSLTSLVGLDEGWPVSLGAQRWRPGHYRPVTVALHLCPQLRACWPPAEAQHSQLQQDTVQLV